MIIGVPKEIKTGEQRVALTPAGVACPRRPRARGARRARRRGRAAASATTSTRGVGASLVPTPTTVWAEADLVLKVKEPQPDASTRGSAPEQILFTYLHLAAVPELTRALRSGHHRARVRDGAARRRERSRCSRR